MGSRFAPLLSRLEAAWRRSDATFAMLGPGALGDRPIPLRHPFVFYLGHLPAFAWNQAGRGVLDRAPFRADFDELFERGIDPARPDPDGARADWPAVEEILAYRDRCRGALREAVPALEGRASDVLADRGRVLSLVIEHELMHHETLLYMMRQLPHGRKARPRDWPPLDTRRLDAAGAPVLVPAGRAALGARFEDAEFGWDNEFPVHGVDVPGFRVDALPVRVRDYLDFAGARGWEARPRGLFEDPPIEAVLDWPAYVTGDEARAYAAARGGRLMTEAEFHRAAYGTPSGDERAFPWGEDRGGSLRGNFGFRHGGPVPVGSHPEGASAWGVHELVGNGWEWTGSAFGPFPGFEPYARTYPGYSRDFFDGEHYVLKGASWATDDALVRRSFRNWFRPDYPYVFAKFRCVYPA